MLIHSDPRMVPYVLPREFHQALEPHIIRRHLQSPLYCCTSSAASLYGNRLLVASFSPSKAHHLKRGIKIKNQVYTLPFLWGAHRCAFIYPLLMKLAMLLNLEKGALAGETHLPCFNRWNVCAQTRAPNQVMENMAFFIFVSFFFFSLCLSIYNIAVRKSLYTSWLLQQNSANLVLLILSSNRDYFTCLHSQNLEANTAVWSQNPITFGKFLIIRLRSIAHCIVQRVGVMILTT